MPTLLPPPTVVPRAPVITAEARLKVRLWRAPRRESIPFCRGDWSIARTPSTLFIPHPHPLPPVIPVPRHGNPSPGRAARAEPVEVWAGGARIGAISREYLPTDLPLLVSSRGPALKVRLRCEGSRTCPLTCLLHPSPNPRAGIPPPQY